MSKVSHIKPFISIDSLENGAIMVETAIGMIFLCMMLFTMLDVGLALNQYARISRIAYEGTRIAASVSGIEEGIVCGSATDIGFERDVSDPTCSNLTIQTRIAERLTELLTENGFARLATQDPPTIRTSYTKESNVVNGATYPDLISVELNFTYQPITPFYVGELPLSVKTFGPYLYRTRT